MTRPSAHHILILIACGGITLSSCNKDEVIIGPSGQTEGEYREPTAASSRYADRVYDYTPAPGQFINDPSSGGMTDEILTMQDACIWAKSRLDKRQFVSLGGFGGYIVVGFDHSILSSDGEYDFAVAGNAFFNSSGGGGSNEPGIVYVMQDSNGNGLPDDTWYELKGSESGSGDVMRDYSVTYYKPDMPASDVEWQDNRGESGFIDYLPAFHKQPYYYPAWISDTSYTLSGTCLKARNDQDSATGLWNNNAYDFGYSDNMGNDACSTEDFAQCNRFRS
ncbi:MAG: hypothetical protein K2K93_05220, partial [Muribaculaceae bacterium]|nr:hypothetical protein [Muribaculaceae bacterium]